MIRRGGYLLYRYCTVVGGGQELREQGMLCLYLILDRMVWNSFFDNMGTFRGTQFH